jgi:hypothetical protein
MAKTIMTAWTCETCDVAGRSPGPDEPTCWNCDGPVTVTARPHAAA